MYVMMVGNFDSVTGEVTDLGVHLGGNESFVVFWGTKVELVSASVEVIYL